MHVYSYGNRWDKYIIYNYWNILGINWKTLPGLYIHLTVQDKSYVLISMHLDNPVVVFLEVNSHPHKYLLCFVITFDCGGNYSQNLEPLMIKFPSLPMASFKRPKLGVYSCHRITLLYAPVNIVWQNWRYNRYSSPRKEKYSKYPTGKYLVPHEWIRILNPNGGKQGGIPEKESLGIANTKGDRSWRQTELIPRCQLENSNEDPSWCQKELILWFQRKLFVPTEFEIQIWVFNFGSGVQYYKIWINGFPFARLTFLLSRRSGKKTDVCYNFKYLPSHP